MKISIITVSYNSEKTIERTINSILNQKNVELEYLIIDGASNDNTINIANSYIKQFTMRNITYKILSEPDKGIYDAMNKGIKLTTGEIIGILNSDDYYSSPEILESIVSEFTKSNCDSLYGNLLYIKNGKPYRYWKSGKLRSFKYGWMPPHPAFFVKKEIYEKYGLFRLDCGTSADYELMLRFLERNKISSHWIDKTFTYMEAGGASGANLKAYKVAHKNDKKAWMLNEIKPIFCFAWLKKIRKLPQFFLAKFIII